MLVYRDSAQQHASAQVIAGLQHMLEACIGSPNKEESIVACLLRAGELECAVADLARHNALSEEQAGVAAAITDSAAAALLGDASRLSDALAGSTRLRLPPAIELRPAEGFAYYGLHPRLYARLLTTLPSRQPLAVVGIRSIGTTLSAVVAAAARRRLQPAERITVRPAGSPYDRCVEFTAAQREWIAKQLAVGAEFIVVDEGPGRSGSSLLATAEALETLEVLRGSIIIFCSHECDPDALVARDAAMRWRRYRVCCPRSEWLPLPAAADVNISAGEWRRHLLPPGHVWPASWIQTERLKFLDAERRSLLKFEGYGRFGTTALARAEAVHSAGFGPAVESAGDGFVRYARLRGESRRSESLSPQIIQRLASYCAFRRDAFALQQPSGVLAAMVQCNVQEEFGCECPALMLETPQPMICDARLQPHEWVVTPAGEMLKTDATSHGDDHFFPGPCDIAWDIAGCIVEWRMTSAARDVFLGEYRRLSGDDPRARLDDHLLAYAAARMGWTKMAAESCGEGNEQQRLLNEYQRYRESTSRILGNRLAGSVATAPAAAHCKIAPSSGRSAATSTPL